MAKNNNKANPAQSKEWEEKNVKQGKNSKRGNSAKNSYSKQKNDYQKAKGKVIYINNLWKSQNDPGWYNRLTQLFKDSVLISFFNQLGAKWKFKGTTHRVAGVYGLKMITGPGTSTDVNSPASMAAIGMYEATRKALNKPISDYEPADMWQVMFATSDIFSQYSNMSRLLAIINTWDAVNLYVPRAILNETYVPTGHVQEFYSDLITNMADYRYQFNLLTTKATSFLYMPEDFAIVRRHSWLFGSVFRDHKSTKGQLYIHAKTNVWQFNEAKYDTGTACEFRYIWPADYTGPFTFQRYLDLYSDCIEALRNSSSVRAIIADMRQAFSDHNEFAMGYVDERTYVDFVDSDEVLSQIENLEVFPVDPTTGQFAPVVKQDSWDITQDPNTNAIIYNPTYTTASGAGYLWSHYFKDNDHILNMHTENPSDDDKMVATRNKFNVVNIKEVGDGESCNVDFGADLCVGTYILSNPDDPDTFGVYYPDPFLHIYGQFDPVAVTRTIAGTATFDWAPFYYIKHSDTTDFWTPVGDLDNYTIIDESILHRAHLTAMLSLWSIPEHGEFKIG